MNVENVRALEMASPSNAITVNGVAGEVHFTGILQGKTFDTRVPNPSGTCVVLINTETMAIRSLEINPTVVEPAEKVLAVLTADLT